MKLAFGSDHAGFELKEHMMSYARSKGYEVIDYGTFSNERCNYPVFGRAVANAVANGTADRGILCCGTGFGISLAANRVKGIRAVNATEELTVKMSRHHNNSNILSMGARVIGVEKAESLFDVFMSEEFDGGRHAGRIELIDTVE